MAYTLGQLVTQIKKGPAQFLPNYGDYPTGPGALPGGQNPGDGGGPVYSGGGTAPPSGSGTPAATTSSSTGWINSILNWLVQPGSATGSFLLRLLLFILGLICIAGAIYLYKGSNPLLAVPAKLAKGAVKAGSAAVKAAAQGEE